ncbi:golvesin C-terminal-like domain-containing protein [Phytoactinopolyspora halotolerans]|uniref:N-acetylmuramoyl-L-alanine amidase n=1 Tax=Phytoactinopolyspora halotolerans TaxID=1981512 RepID=A0A6L9SAD0_9ACTN|nr:N-acetylmuramoyl-L-alanine amidase [Phytoactinopolyspora halotolerans]NEE02206.1 amidase [Phytoactinopolyspora halotolerans]
MSAVPPSTPSATTFPTLSRRRALALGGGALLGAVVAGSGVLPAQARTASALDRAFDQAASRHGVPRDLLVAVGYAETRLTSHDGPSQSKGYGLMHLVDNSFHHTLVEAAELTKHSPRKLRTNEAANIDGAAAVLRAYADDAGLSAGTRKDLGAWYPIVARYSGAGDSYVAGLYADGVYEALWNGVNASGVALDANPVEPDRSVATRDVGVMTDDYPPALWVAAHSSNYTSSNRPSSYPINYVVIHMMQGTYAGSISWFQNPSANVSAHYCIRSSDGQVTQMVRHKDYAWHAGNSSINRQSIGIEHEGYFDQASWYTEAMYRSSAALTRHVCDTYGIPKTRQRIIGHNEASSTPCPGQIWDWTRYMGYVTEDTGGGDPVWDVVVDAPSSDVTAGSSWEQSSWSGQKYGDAYLFNTPEPISDPVWYRADLPESGTYRVEVWYPSDTGYNDSTPYVVVTSSGNQTVRVNQRAGGGGWRAIGTFTMSGGARDVVGVSRWTSGSGYLIADAVRLSLLK